MKFKYTNTSGIEESIINKHKASLSEYTKLSNKVIDEKNYEADEASLCLPHDELILRAVRDIVKKKNSPQLKYIIDIGIGGSNLGTKAIYDALLGYSDLFNINHAPKLVFLDTSDPEYISHFTQFIKENVKKKEEIVVNIISKSGGTTETAVNGEIVIELISSLFNDWKERFVVTTNKHSHLWESAVSLGIDVMEIPKKVGGRYSVFSPVGLFPLALCGINIELLLEGARSAGRGDSALSSAAILYEHLQQGVAICDNFYFHSELESLGKWYRQLMGESTGKMGMGLTPTVSMGSVDLHSVVQLYLGGPKNRVTSFIYTNQFSTVSIPAKNVLTHIQEIQGKNVGDIMSAIQHGTINAYKNVNLPLTEIVLEGINAKELGEYMQFKMWEIMYLGKLMKVNTFDQPEVELYKIETKKILSAK